MFSLKTHTAKYGQWSQHSPPFTRSRNGWTHRRTDVVTLPKQEALIPMYLYLSWPKRRMGPRLDFQGWEAFGLHGDGGSHFTTWTSSIAVAGRSGSWIFPLAPRLWQPQHPSITWFAQSLPSSAWPLNIAVPSLRKHAGSLEQLFLFSASSLITTFNKSILSTNTFRAKEPSGFQGGHWTAHMKWLFPNSRRCEAGCFPPGTEGRLLCGVLGPQYVQNLIVSVCDCEGFWCRTKFFVFPFLVPLC